MAWTAPRTWVTGETVTAAVMNAHVRDNLKAIGDAWTSYTPALAGTGWAIGNGTVAGGYIQAGKLVVFRASITFGSTSTYGASATPTISLPVTANSAFTNDGFDCQLIDTGTLRYSGVAVFDGSTTVLSIFAVLASGTYASQTGCRSTIPHTWASTDKIVVSGVYEAA